MEGIDQGQPLPVLAQLIVNYLRGLRHSMNLEINPYTSLNSWIL